ncbi:GNAT family N-acetyltransferase [Plantactinospora siamensis]|uniref:GNAT family N-acetyltransferase n=1 Tax=Plantactinospora siamensis TaxID=555372 RepID=A0ABV6NXA5_9ACTN
MVHELAEFERAPEQCRLTANQLRAALFPADRPAALFGHVAVDGAGAPLGYALWFLNFSTWAGVHGVYLEDLYVRPAARGTGAGRRLLAALAQVCVERGYERLEWVMIDWNPAGDFYRAVGAAPTDGWVPYRLTGPALRALAERSGAVPAPVEFGPVHQRVESGPGGTP